MYMSVTKCVICDTEFTEERDEEYKLNFLCRNCVDCLIEELEKFDYIYTMDDYEEEIERELDEMIEEGYTAFNIV